MLRTDAKEQGVVKEVTYHITVFDEGFAIVEVETETDNTSFYTTTPALHDPEDLREHLYATLVGALEWEEPSEYELEDFYSKSSIKLH